MVRTTVYLPEELKTALERVARVEQRSEADLIREGVQRVVETHTPRRPRFPLFESDDPTIAERLDELLEGFGER